MAANEWDIQVALVQMAEADTGAGGLVQLIGKPHPLIEWSDEGIGKLPIATIFFPDLRMSKGTGSAAFIDVQLDAHVGEGAGGLESRIMDRLETLINASALAARGIDAAPTVRTRRDLSSLAESGKRKCLEMQFRFARL